MGLFSFLFGKKKNDITDDAPLILPTESSDSTVPDGIDHSMDATMRIPDTERPSAIVAADHKPESKEDIMDAISIALQQKTQPAEGGISPLDITASLEDMSADIKASENDDDMKPYVPSSPLNETMDFSSIDAALVAAENKADAPKKEFSGIDEEFHFEDIQTEEDAEPEIEPEIEVEIVPLDEEAEEEAEDSNVDGSEEEIEDSDEDDAEDEIEESDEDDTEDEIEESDEDEIEEEIEESDEDDAEEETEESDEDDAEDEIEDSDEDDAEDETEESDEDDSEEATEESDEDDSEEEIEDSDEDDTEEEEEESSAVSPAVQAVLDQVKQTEWGTHMSAKKRPPAAIPTFDNEGFRLVWKLKGTSKKRRVRTITDCIKGQPVFVICNSNGSKCTVITEDGEEIGRLNEQDSAIYHNMVAGNPHHLYIKKIRMNQYKKPSVKILVIVHKA